MTDTSNIMSTEDTLLAFGEWLDSQHTCYNPNHDNGDLPEETHEDIAREFIEHWESDPKRATLAGRLGAQIGASLRKVVDGLVQALEESGDRLPKP